MFFDRRRVGAFAISPRAFQRGEGPALFKLLIAVSMFQRRQDVQILRILREMARDDARDVSDAAHLLDLADTARCPLVRNNVDLITRCDLAKDPATKRGVCGYRPRTPCHLKQHTAILKRYGHFGKIPTSAALVLREAGVRTLGELRAQVLSEETNPNDRAAAMERRLSKNWRGNQKIAGMFLSMVCNPGLSPGAAPRSSGLDWTHFVVIDSNVDLFLKSINYRGGATYDERRAFVLRLAEGVDLSSTCDGIHAYNPRVVQQALYLFMSKANRRAIAYDCANLSPSPCGRCPRVVSSRCQTRPEHRKSHARTEHKREPLELERWKE
jgi:hypothetical protein